MNKKLLKNRGRLILLLILVFVIQSHSWAQQKSKCFEKIKKYYDDMSRIGFPEGKKVYYFHYINDTETYNDKTIKRDQVHVRVYMGSEQMHNISDDIEIYQDLENAFMLIKSRKVIIQTESSLKINKEVHLSEVLSFQDSLFRHMELKACKEFTGKSGTEYLIADMMLDSLTNAYHGMRNIRFTYNLDKKSIDRVKFDYLPGQKLKSLTQTIIETDFNHSKKLNKPVKDIFFTPDWKLKPKYAGYRYVKKK